MAEMALCKHWFAIVSANGVPYKTDHHAGEIKERHLMRCVYLTRSITAAVEMQRIARRISIRVHRAANLAEAAILLRITGARVVLVDLPLARQSLERFLRTLDRACPRAAIVGVAAEVDADRWEDVALFGGFDMVLRPFSREELAVVLDAAEEYARRQRTPEANARRLAELHSLIRDPFAATRAETGLM